MALTPTTIPLGNRPYVSPYNSVGKEICRNLYVEIAQSETAKASYYMVKIPGLRLTTPQTSFASCRGLFGTGSRVFGVWGNELVEIFQSGARSVRGTLRAYSGVVSFAENGYQMIFVDGDAGYIYDYSTETLRQIQDDYFPGTTDQGLAPTHVVALDTYFLVNVPGTNGYLWSNSYYKNTNGSDYDPNVPQGYWNGLQLGQKIGKSDPIVALSDAQNFMWVFGSYSTEVHYDTGDNNTQLWARYSGALIDIGCSAPYSVAKYATNVFWIGADRAGTVGVFSNEGMAPKRISTRGIEQIIQGLSRYDDAQGFCYAQNGHSFYVLHFPTADCTYCYDLATASWHERTYLDPLGNVRRWRGTWIAQQGSVILAGDNQTNAVYAVDKSYYANDNPIGDGSQNYIQCVKTTPINFQNGLRVRYASAQPILQQGVGLNTGIVPGFSTTDPDSAFGKYPKCAIAWSDDSGNTWSTERLVDIGALGKYGTRTRTLNCGLSRNRVWRLTVTDPVDVIMVGLLVETEVLNS